MEGSAMTTKTQSEPVKKKPATSSRVETYQVADAHGEPVTIEHDLDTGERRRKE